MLAVPLFVLMGEVLFHSGVSWIISDSLDLWIGRIPGRLSLLAIALGTLFAALSGSGIATTAMLGSILIPEMRRKGYSKSMCAGPVLGGGSLAIVMPPTFIGVILATLAEVSVGGLLVAVVVPCLLVSALYSTYIVITAIMHPDWAPRYEITDVSWFERMKALRYIAPLGIIIFFVVGSIFTGLATPTEAAALGAMSTCILVACYRRLEWNIVSKALRATASISSTVFMIIIGSQAFSQLLAYTGATKGLITFAMQAHVSPLVLLALMQLAIFVMGTFMDQVSVMMISIPMFKPVVSALGFDVMWFCVMTLVNLALGGITPPFGLFLFALKSVSPEDFSMGDIIRATVPYFLLGLIAIFILLIFPKIALWPLKWMT